MPNPDPSLNAAELGWRALSRWSNEGGALMSAREMGDYISPRRGFSHHPLTIQATNHMTNLIDRAIHFRTVKS